MNFNISHLNVLRRVQSKVLARQRPKNPFSGARLGPPLGHAPKIIHGGARQDFSRAVLIHSLFLFVSACFCLFLLSPACSCLFLFVPVVSCLFLSVVPVVYCLFLSVSVWSCCLLFVPDCFCLFLLSSVCLCLFL